MNKLFITAVAVAVLAFAVPVGVGLAQGSIDLGVESVGLLPPNPFYFIKEWGRGFRSLFAKNIKRAELELIVLNEKAAELQKLEEITSGNIESLITAAATYRESADSLKERLSQIKETSVNPNVDRLLSSLADRTLRHLYLFEQLQSKFATEADLQAALENLHNALAAVLAGVPARLDPPGKFQSRYSSLLSASQDQLREWRLAWFLSRLEEKLEGAARDEVISFKEDLLASFAGRLEGLSLSGVEVGYILENFPGNPLRKLVVLDELRESIQNSDLKNQLNLLYQNLLNQLEEASGVGEAEANQALLSAEDLLADAEAKADELGTVRKSVKELIERARFHINQAEQFIGEELYGAAFGQAIAAKTAARGALSAMSMNLFNQSETLDNLKQLYDTLLAKATMLGLTKESDPGIFKIFTEVEKKLVGLRADSSTASLRSVRMKLSTLEELIK